MPLLIAFLCGGLIGAGIYCLHRAPRGLDTITDFGFGVLLIVIGVIGAVAYLF